MRTGNVWQPEYWNDSGKNKSTRRKDVTRYHTRRYMFTHKMTHITQGDTCSHTRWHTFTWKCCTVFIYVSPNSAPYVINKQGTIFFNFSQFLSHIMPFSIKNSEFPSVPVIYSMVYTVSALLYCFQYWVNFLYVMYDICTLGWWSKDSSLWKHIPSFL
jgi:hypothetical protein